MENNEDLPSVWVSLFVIAILGGVLSFAIAMGMKTGNVQSEKNRFEKQCEKECINQESKDSFDWCVEKCKIIKW